METDRTARPSRSDVHLGIEEEARFEEEARLHFDGLAPKRHTKPSRSEYSSLYQDSFPQSDSSIPEFLNFQSLQSRPHQKITYEGKEGGEEFVETEYYEDLNCIDKQHHTTGTGFITMEGANGKYFSLGADSVSSCHSSSRGNPATNDWIPVAPDHMDTVASNKPKRSEN